MKCHAHFCPIENMTDRLSLVEASTTVPNKILCIAWSYTMEHVNNPTAVETLLREQGIPFSKKANLWILTNVKE